ncbi:uncharacterized protein PG998_012093 [Apiospora kogelbergensis]|uniref:uncharacterized protein n=1 Tax=Apiospora kogelbergensis TaxID=1337665 RepID=UPI0031304899
MGPSSAAGDDSPVPGFAFHDDGFDDEPIPYPLRDSTRQRFGNFDSQLLALGPHASPDQAKRALEAHLAETDRRMEEAGRLGTALVAQRKELEERLEEVVNQQAEGELSEELREKLVEIEREYNEVAKESARAFLPKPRVPSNEAAGGSPFVPEGKGGRRSVSPSKFEAQAVASPTKLSVPNRKVRNQPAQRVHDIEFAAEISTSLIAQVRNLQSILSEKEEELRDIKAEKSRLEYDAEGFQQRVKILDESESRYKDENWSLETQEAADREKKLQQSVNILQAEKTLVQRELDESKMNHARLVDEYAASVKTHDVELGAAKRNLVMADSERAALNRKIEDLTGQNQELARAFSQQRRITSDHLEVRDLTDEDYQSAHRGDTPDHSPPPSSPIKGTPRHSMLESETLKTSLGHAQRTIQSLRTNVHREKTEKLELRRMLQDARDELEKARQDPMPEKKRPSRKTDHKEFKKPPPRLLGNLRPVRSEIYIDEEDWEDQSDAGTVRGDHSFSIRRSPSGFEPVMESIETDDHFETANETSDQEQAFDTANDRSGNTTDDFHTGAEEFSSSDDDAMTETDNSTASTDDESAYDGRRTPTHQFPLQARFPLRVGRGAYRRSRQGSEASFQSPASYTVSSTATTPQQGVQNLAAELGEFDGSDNESNRSATPSRSIYSRPGSIRCRTSSPVPPVPALPRLLMVESGMMTEPMSELPSIALAAGTDRPMSMATVASQSSEMGTQYLDESLAKFPSPPTSAQFNGISHEDAENLKEEHARQIEQLHAENAAAHATAVDSLKTSHADALSRALGEAKSVHAQEVENMKLTHAELANKSAEASAAHASELEALRADHDAKIAQIESELKAQHSSELEALKANHEKELASALKQSDETHRAELTALLAAHTAQIELAKKQLSASHEKDLESLKAKHAEQIDLSKQGSDAAHAEELEKLKAAHLAQIDEANNNLRATHGQELEALKTAHATQVEQAKDASSNSHAAELAALAAAHALQLKSAKTDSDENLAKEIGLLKTAHEDQLRTSKAEADAYLARELESLKATHAEQLQSTKADGESTLARELEAMQTKHAKQLEAANAESAARLERELEDLKAAHAKQLEESKREGQAAQEVAVGNLAAYHASTLEEAKAKSEASHLAAIDSLKAAHAKEIEDLKVDKDTAQAAAIAALTASHAKALSSTKADADAEMAKQLDSLRKSHSQELKSLMDSHSKELASLEESHSSKLEALRAEHAAASAKELEGFKAALSKQMESTRSEGDAAHTAQLESIKSAHSEIMEAHKREKAAADAALESAKANHERQLETLRSEHAAAKSKELGDLSSKHEAEIAAATAALLVSKDKEIDELLSSHNDQLAKLKDEHSASMAQSLEQASSEHATQLQALQAELTAVKTRELEALASTHGKQVEALQAEYAAAKAKDFEEMTSSHEKQIQALHIEANNTKAQELEEMSKAHEEAIRVLKAEAAAAKLVALEELSASHGIHTKSLSAEAEAQKAKELDELSAMHAAQLESRKAEHEAAVAKLSEEMAASHELKLQALGTETGASQAKELEALRAAHEKDVAALRSQHEGSRAKELDELNTRHNGLLESLRTEHKSTLDQALANLKTSHDKDIDSLNGTHAATTAAALEALKSNHAKQLDAVKAENEAELARHLDSIRKEHKTQLEAQESGSLAEKEKLVAAHALELETLRKSLAVAKPTLQYSTVSAVSTEPIEQTNEEGEARRSPKRDAFILPHERDPHTPTHSAIGVLGRRNKDKGAAPIIAEDETRQSPSSVTAGPETPESQRPFKEMSTNTDARPARKPKVPTSDNSCQTALTSEGIEYLMTKKQHQRTTSSDSLARTPYVATPGSPIRHQRRTSSQDSGRGVPGDSSLIAGAEPIPARRPGSSASAQTPAHAVPPLPANHREAIEAARTGSSSGPSAKGAMGPPLMPASAYKNSSRPWTPRENRPMSPASFASQPRLGTPTPRAGRTQSHQGHAELHSPTRVPGRSRQSSLSSFTSEIETRFNANGGALGVDMSDLAGTDPRMIQAITQTMIGEYLWKYTRKAGRGEMSENRHRRYFWVHPYTRTLYWSTSDPSAAGKAELRAKSVPIEAVRVVSDDNPMPPGLHRKSLVIISPGRTIKFTCTTGQRHETWFNALSYLLLRTGEEGQADTEEIAGNITQDEVNEFNPNMSQKPASGNRPRAPPSLSSYNSRTTRTESPNIDMMAIPTLTPTHERGTARPSTIGRLSRYGSGFFNSVGRKSKTGLDNAIYEASEVNDSAEELRQIIEQQDRESDRLENVRACCDGKHDVGTLSHSSKRNRNSSSNQLNNNTHNHAHPGPGRSTTPTPSLPTTLRSRG